jgi:hypothetical protein
MQHANKAVISPKLKAVMALQRALEDLKNAEPSEQGPAGPTVAGLAEDAGRKALGEQDPSAIASPDSGIAGIAQNAATGNAIMMAQQQQQGAPQGQPQGPPVAAPPQMPPPPGMASGGIATLRADNMRGFKEGGVLGFATEPFLVPGSKENYEKGNVKNAEKDKILDSIADAEWAKKLEASKLLEESTMRARAAAMRSGNLPPAISERPVRDAARIQQFATAPTALGIQELEAERARNMAEVNAEASAPPPPVARPPAAPAARPPVVSAGPAQPTSAPIAEPDVTEMIDKIAASARKNAIVNPYVGQLAAADKEAARLRAAQPLPGIEGLAAYRKAQAEEDALNTEARGTEGSRALRSLFRGFETRDPDAVSSTMAGFTKERRDAIKATENRAQLTSALVDAQNAKAAGDKEKEAAALEKVAKIMGDQQKLQSDMATHGMSYASSVASQTIHGKYQLETEKLRNASAEKLAAISRAHAEAMKNVPDYEHKQMDELVKQIAGPGADPVKILAARESVMVAYGKIPGDSNNIKRLALGEKAAEAFDKDNANRKLIALNKKDAPELLKIATEREEARNRAMGGEGSKPRTPEQAAALKEFGLN